MWVKICANTNLEDAHLAAELGADALGFVFAPSKRRVTAEQVAAITPHLPASVERVGVFQTRDAIEIAGIAQAAGLTAVQLHGGFDPSLVEELGVLLGPAVGIIQVLHWALDAGAEAKDRVLVQLETIQELPNVARVLIDSKLGSASGGTGITFDWSAARSVFRSADPRLKLIVAGGLTPENVADAIAQLQPYGVDVASGVEAAPGRKDPLRLAAFLRNARRTA